MNKIPAIPTKYKGRNYRSRLEARWAAMFDLLHWSVEYEPFDLNGYIPDFILHDYFLPIIVEVKPFCKREEWSETINKIEKATKGNHCEDMEILLLGYKLPISEYQLSASMGWLGEIHPHCEDEKPEDYCKYWVDLALINENKGDLYVAYKDKPYGLYHEYASYLDRITGVYEGDHHLKTIYQDKIDSLWAEAGNRVQWKP